MDGGLTDNLPEPATSAGRTICVSPFSGCQDISPADSWRRQWRTSINNQPFLLAPENIVRGVHAFFPPRVSVLENYYARGCADTERFLKAEGLWEEDPELSVYRTQYEQMKKNDGAE